ncbi:MAG: alpha-amylase family glycosyl hydrolase [Chitinophagaceae bacterium]|nr:alpha-amylase family glycosyl hydrolase [Chitinophagaceae bacterium]
MTPKIHIYQIFTRIFGNKNKKTANKGTIQHNGTGKFDDITTKALVEIQKLGITHIWYTGIIEHGTKTDYSQYGIPKDNEQLIKGTAGSPYAIKDYYDVCPDLANNILHRIQEFQNLIERTHSVGLKVIIDFVPNHIFRNYFSDIQSENDKTFGHNDNTHLAFHPENNFYYLPEQELVITFQENLPSYKEFPAKATGNDIFHTHISPHDWYETIKLNYGVDYAHNMTEHFTPLPNTWEKMLDILLYWSNMGVDGFRCDMAQMVPIPFWQWLIPQMKAKKDTIFIAEIYTPEKYYDYIHTAQFDLLYDKVDMYDTLRNILQHKQSTDTISHIWKKQEGIAQNMLRFLENHDEQRIASHYFLKNPIHCIPAIALITTMHKNSTLLYFGQEVGEKGDESDEYQGRTSIFDYTTCPEHQKWMNDGQFDTALLSEDTISLRNTYQQILSFSLTDNCIREGEFYDLQYFNRTPSFSAYSDTIFAYIRHTKETAYLIILNFDTTKDEECSIKIPSHAFQTMDMQVNEGLDFTNIFNTQETIPIPFFKIPTLLHQIHSTEDTFLTIPKSSFKIFKISPRNLLAK